MIEAAFNEVIAAYEKVGDFEAATKAKLRIARLQLSVVFESRLISTDAGHTTTAVSVSKSASRVSAPRLQNTSHYVIRNAELLREVREMEVQMARLQASCSVCVEHLDRIIVLSRL